MGQAQLAVIGNLACLDYETNQLTTEEIEMNHPLIEAGIDVVETDLGELIIQLVNEKPFHLVFPSVHKMAPEVAKIFSA